MIELFDMILDESKSEKRTIRSSLRVMIVHMLKCKYQNEYEDKRSWRASIVNGYFEIDDAFEGKRKGSLYKKFYLKDLDLEAVYKKAVTQASIETGKSKSEFPKECEWSKDQLVNFDYIDNFIDIYGQDSR